MILVAKLRISRSKLSANLNFYSTKWKKVLLKMVDYFLKIMP